MTAPAHPATNGLAERYVGHFKTRTTQVRISNEPLSVRLDKFLFAYRSTPTTIGKSPAELFMKRQPKTRFDLLRQKSLQNTKQQVKIFQDNSEFKADFTPSQAVFVLNFGKGRKWLPGIILKVLPTEIPTKTAENIPAPTSAREPSNKPIMSTPKLKERKGKEMTTEQLSESNNKSSISKDTIPEPYMKEIAPEPRYPRRERRKPERLVIEY